MPLCDVCQNFDLHSFDRVFTNLRGYPIQDLLQRPECDFCSLLLRTLKGSHGPTFKWVQLHIPRGKPISTLIVRDTDTSPASLSASSESFKGPKLNVFAAPAAARSGHVQELEPDPVTTWVRECRHHKACNWNASGPGGLDATISQLPTRCINVGLEEGTLPFLEETATQTGTYITLSYRWTDETKTTATTLQNYQNHQNSIDATALPKLLEEAIRVTRHLRIPYLWIDSLCIIQENEQDWDREAQKMAAYYQGAALTLVAMQPDCLLPQSVALDVPDSFFNIQLGSRSVVRLPYRDTHGVQRGHFYVSDHNSLDDVFRTEVQGSELLSRAWVFQERNLSRRLLYFTPKSIIYSCRSQELRNSFNESLKPQDLHKTLAQRHHLHDQWLKISW